MDGSGVTSLTGPGGGTVNCQYGAGAYEKFVLGVDGQHLATGRFDGTADNERVDLRIDLTGPVPVISGDTFSVPDGQYLNSFVLEGSQPVTLPATITGTATFANSTQMPKISVVVDKLAPGGTATLTRSAADGTAATTFTCSYVSRFLRTIDWEVDAVAGTQPPVQYATTADPRPAGLTEKLITVHSTYAEAGIELRASGAVVNEVAVDQAGADLKWSDAELHAAMVSNFSSHREIEQWKVWSFIATRHRPGRAADGRNAQGDPHLGPRARPRPQPAAQLAEGPGRAPAATRAEWRLRRPVVDELPR